jgi:hypothetical protein
MTHIALLPYAWNMPKAEQVKQVTRMRKLRVLIARNEESLFNYSRARIRKCKSQGRNILKQIRFAN